MKLRFTNKRNPESLEELPGHLLSQLITAGKLYSGEELEPEVLLAPCEEDDEVEEWNFYGFISLWDIVDEEENVCYEAWFYQVDSGTIFNAGTCDVAAEVIQFGLECDDEELESAILDAVALLKKEDKESAKDISIMN